MSLKNNIRLLLVCFLWNNLALADVYKWTDEKGAVHYSNSKDSPKAKEVKGVVNVVSIPKDCTKLENKEAKECAPEKKWYQFDLVKWIWSIK